MSEPTQVTELELLVTDGAAIVPSEREHQEIVEVLRDVAGRLPQYKEAATRPVLSQAEALVAARDCENMAADIAAVEKVSKPWRDRVFKFHRRITGFVGGMFAEPLEDARKRRKAAIIRWEQAEADKAEAERARLQAEADARARADRERLEKEAARLKTPEKREQRLEQAAQIVAPVVRVDAPTSGIRKQRRWVVVSVEKTPFMLACVQDRSLLGYVEIETVRLERAKAANPELQVPGIKFEHRVC